MFLNGAGDCFSSYNRGRLTVTKVVFEFVSSSNNSFISLGLTVTKVVFE